MTVEHDRAHFPFPTDFTGFSQITDEEFDDALREISQSVETLIADRPVPPIGRQFIIVTRPRAGQFVQGLTHTGSEPLTLEGIEDFQAYGEELARETPTLIAAYELEEMALGSEDVYEHNQPVIWIFGRTLDGRYNQAMHPFSRGFEKELPLGTRTRLHLISTDSTKGIYSEKLEALCSGYCMTLCGRPMRSA
jgi:hypothetical protein